MLPVVTPQEMGEIDADAPEPVELLIERAGAAVARSARDLLGGTYGRRVVVVAGKGNNGNDGRSAAERLRRLGVNVAVVDVADAPHVLPECDLVIDAAFGTGFRGTYAAPDPGRAAVLAVDIPSGIDGLTGAAHGGVMAADVTVTFAALKPGLLFGEGRSLAGEIELADIGLDVSRANCHLVEEYDPANFVPRRSTDDHKWDSGCLVVAGSPGMGGAAHLSAASAQRGGAGMVLLVTPGASVPASMPLEAVSVDGTGDWVARVSERAQRVEAMVIGPGATIAPDDLRSLLEAIDVPVVIDGGGLDAVAGAATALAGREVVLTPHDGEYTRLMDRRPGDDRIAAARAAAARFEVTVLLKGPTTVVASPDGRSLVMADGDERLATAGSGDVLAGLLGSFLARGADPLEGAAAAALLHAAAADRAGRLGLVASDLLEAVTAARADLDV